MQTSAQPEWILHKSYESKYYFADSLFVNHNHLNPPLSIEQLQAWQKWADKNNDPELAGEFTLLEYRLSRRLEKMSDSELEKNMLALSAYARKNKVPFLEAEALHVTADFYRDVKKKYDQALEKYLSAYKLYVNFSSADFPAKHEYLYDLGLTFYGYDDIDNSLKYLKEALSTAPSKKIDVNFAVYNTIGLGYRKLKQYDSAEWYFQYIAKAARAANRNEWEGIASGNTGITYFLQHRYAEAIPMLEKDIESGKINNVKNTAVSMGYLASIYYYQKNYDKSEQILKQALSMCEDKHFWPDYPLAAQLFGQLYKIYADKNNLRLAYAYADSTILARDSVETKRIEHSALNLAKAQERYNFLQHELEDEQVQSQRRIQVFRRNCLLGGIFMLLVIGALVINRQRLKRRKLEVEKKHAESELTAASVKLESFREIDVQKKLVEEKNTELSETIRNLEEAQAQLVQAEKMASLGQLTAGIAHEINNPVNFVSASIDPLRKDVEDILEVIEQYEQVIKERQLGGEFATVEKFKQKVNIELTKKETWELLKGLEEGALRTAGIVRGLKNFSRLDQNTLKMANLNDCIESTLVILYPAYKNRVEIIKDFGDIPEINCFPGQLNQVFMNILSNAIQAIPGNGKIFIKTWLIDKFVKVSIRDTGAGMAKETISKIFDPFFTTKEVGKGTGLGLSISYGIIEKHKGKIEVFSELNKGTEFVITIPLNQD